jgi:hypothetical protein
MNKNKLSRHIKLCLKNLRSNRTKCCANCPFEEEILSVYPDMKELFEDKRKKMEKENAKRACSSGEE